MLHNIIWQRVISIPLICGIFHGGNVHSDSASDHLCHNCIHPAHPPSSSVHRAAQPPVQKRGEESSFRWNHNHRMKYSNQQKWANSCHWEETELSSNFRLTSALLTRSCRSYSHHYIYLTTTYPLLESECGWMWSETSVTVHNIAKWCVKHEKMDTFAKHGHFQQCYAQL